MTTKQIVFSLLLLCTLGVFAFTMYRIIRFFSFTKKGFPVRNIPARIWLTLKVVVGQTKIFRRPLVGLLHALVFWGFCVILFGSIEMVIDGVGGKEKSLHGLGFIYDLFMLSGDVFAPVIALAVIIFLIRRNILHVKRFEGIEMKPVSHLDANIALTIILVLMISLTGMNAAYCALQGKLNQPVYGIYPAGAFVARWLSSLETHQLEWLYQACWWMHITLIFIFANILPYSKHFHVFMSVPNVFLSRLEPLGKLYNMESVTREVKMMLYPEMVSSSTEAPPSRFGVKDADDVVWKTYFDSLACTECGRCTSVCPANLTGKKLSPRKVMMDLRARMKEKGLQLLKNKDFNDNKSLVRDYISEEEIWACTTCNACARECPININHPSLIVDMRRYLVMEEGLAPGEIKAVFSNIENNGAPWQYSPEDRLLWAKDLEMNVH